MKSCSGSLWGSGCASSFAITSRHTAALLPPLPITTGAGWGPWLFPGGAGPYQPAQVLEADVELVPPADLAPVRGVDVICREEGRQRQPRVLGAPRPHQTLGLHSPGGWGRSEGASLLQRRARASEQAGGFAPPLG